MGLSVEEVTNKLLGQDNFSAAVASIEASDPNFSKAEWTGGSGPKGIISFAGKPSSDSRKTLRSLPFKVELRTDEKLSATSQSAALEEAFSKFSTLDGIANPTGYIDQTTNTIQLQHAEIPSEEMPGTDLV
ncbi:hypothetical protein AR689_02220 [Arthrobacter sp. EpRS71]|nr:hypothetical protein AR689_02220 [Arthrobacter sp. EpRS71]